MRYSVNEGGTFYTDVSFRNSFNASFVPASVDYKIHDITTNTEIKAWTSVTPATTVSISVTPTETQIVDDTNSWEARELLVRFTDDGGNTQMQVAHYRVMNLGGVDG